MLGLHLVILLRLSNPIQIFLRLRTRKEGEIGAEDYFCQLFVAFYRMDVKCKNSINIISPIRVSGTVT